MLRLRFLMSIVLITFSRLFAQVDSSSVVEARKNTLKQYTQALQTQSMLYLGTDYREPPQTEDDQHPFLYSSDWLSGSIEYNGEAYEDVALLYDIHRDKVVTEYLNGNQMELVKEKLSRFSLGDKQFIRILADTVNGSLPRTGFYQLLYGGKSALIALHQKESLETFEMRVIHISYPEKTKYYLFQHGIYHQVKTKKSILSLLSDKKPDLKRFIRKNKMRFRPDRENVLTRIASYYDELKAK